MARRRFLGKMVGNTRVRPIAGKIIGLFIFFLLVSNFATNFINLILNRGELIKQANQLLVKDLKDSYNFAGTQHEIFLFSEDLRQAVQAMGDNAAKDLKLDRSIALGIRRDGSLLYGVVREMGRNAPAPSFRDADASARMWEGADSGALDGTLYFTYDKREYFGVYKYNERWDAVLVRAESLAEFYRDSTDNFVRIAVIILALTALFIFLGDFLLRHILRFVGRITESLMRMRDAQRMELIDLSGAPPDDVTYLGASFNALSSSIGNLLSVFRRFVDKDVAERAYSRRDVRLEGARLDLIVLHSEIRGFAFMGEAVGGDILGMLNKHYDLAIRGIHEADGIVGSIVGDAILAAFGTVGAGRDKAVRGLEAAYGLRSVAESLRAAAAAKRDEILDRDGRLEEGERRFFAAAMAEARVGVDGGRAYYGNVGSYERMSNAVIGAKVDPAARLGRMARAYRVPVLCSRFVKDDAEASGGAFRFVELDRLRAAGTRDEESVFWPLPAASMDERLMESLARFSAGQEAYYAGDWAAASRAWAGVDLPFAGVFRERVAGGKRPEGWDGAWTTT